MPVYPFDHRALHWNAPRPHHSGTFQPTGILVRCGDNAWYHHNPATWQTDRVTSARIVVGFSVGQEPKYTIDDLIRLVQRLRSQDGGNPSASFVAQEGIYQHRDSKAVVHEDGAQVFILNLSGQDDKAFTAEMVALAETIAREFQQEEVIVEIQVNGISTRTIGVGP